MSIIERLYKSNFINLLPKFFLRKLKKAFNYYFVEISEDSLPSKSHPTTAKLENQQILIKNFDNLNYTPSTSCPYLIQLLKSLFINKSETLSFLDFGGENIDHYLYLKKHIKNIKYFYFNQKENIEVMKKLNKQNNFESFNVLNSIEEIKEINFDFINIGSVIQYINNYKEVLNILISTNPKYVFFSAQTFYEKKYNNKENIIVKQVNILPHVNFCFFFEYGSFINIFKIKSFLPIFKTLNLTDRVNFNNFNKKLGKIEYIDLLLGNNKN